MTNIASETGPFIADLMVIVHSYVSLPEGNGYPNCSTATPTAGLGIRRPSWPPHPFVPRKLWRDPGSSWRRPGCHDSEECSGRIQLWDYNYYDRVTTWWLIPRLVRGLVHPSYKWDFCRVNPLIYNWGYNPLTKWDEPPSKDRVTITFTYYYYYHTIISLSDRVFFLGVTMELVLLRTDNPPKWCRPGTAIGNLTQFDLFWGGNPHLSAGRLGYL